MCMAIHATSIERHICTSEWTVSNISLASEPLTHLVFRLDDLTDTPVGEARKQLRRQTFDDNEPCDCS